MLQSNQYVAMLQQSRNKCGELMTWWAYLFRLIPANLLSFLTGYLTRIELPSSLQHLLNRWFVKTFGIDMSEALEPNVNSYKSLEDIFTRALRHGARSMEGNYVSPSDGIVSISLASSGDTALQVKGITYSLSELVFGKKNQNNFEPAWFSTVYLAPHNYHRVHVPFSGQLTSLWHIPGFLWSVNQTFLKAVPQLFNRNERMVFEYKLDQGGTAYVVMVGAFNVGRMTTPHWPNFATNELLRSCRLNRREHKALCRVGEELGTFLLGSTVVVVLDQIARDQLKPRTITEPAAIKVGQSLGQAL